MTRPRTILVTGARDWPDPHRVAEVLDQAAKHVDGALRLLVGDALHSLHGTADLAEGTVYPALYRLEAAGLLSSTWSHVSGRRRRVYRLTRRGRNELARERREWRQFADTMKEVVA